MEELLLFTEMPKEIFFLLPLKVRQDYTFWLEIVPCDLNWDLIIILRSSLQLINNLRIIHLRINPFLPFLHLSLFK